MVSQKILAFVLTCLFSLLACANDTTRTLSLEHVRNEYKGPDSHIIDLEGVNLHYRDMGKGPAILLVHGTLGDASDWDGWANELANQFRVIRLDLPGFGLSGDMKNGNYSVDRALSTVDALMDYLGEETFAIAGISYGGIITFRYAATRTDRVTAMLLVNSAGIQAGKPVKPQASKKDLAKPAPKRNGNLFTSEIVTEQDVLQFYQAYINDPSARTPDFLKRKLDMLNIVGRDIVGVKGRELYERGNPQRVLSHVKAPAAVLWGQGNKALDLETAQAFVDSLTKACHKELHTFESGGHYINVERPKETARVAKTFLVNAVINKLDACQTQ